MRMQAHTITHAQPPTHHCELSWHKRAQVDARGHAPRFPDPDYAQLATWYVFHSRPPKIRAAMRYYSGISIDRRIAELILDNYKHNRMFRFDGRRWLKIEDAQRTNITNGADNNKTLRNSFVNNTTTFVDVNRNTHPEKQSLHEVLRPKSDYK
jgi:hypothetical protein